MQHGPVELDSRRCILFLGSGFSQLAKNIRGDNLPTGDQLRMRLAKLLELDPTKYDLKVLADEVASREDLDLYQTLYELYTIKELHSAQDTILQLPWMRIYTTNFDDAVEFASIKNSSNLQSYDYNDEKPRKLQYGSVIHLHGTIQRTTQNNVLDQLVLNENAYIRQHFEKSSWYDDFVRDLRFCSACFFVGYSLSDYHISALLMQNPSVSDKTYFITPENPDSILSKRVMEYGKVLPIEVEGFAHLCRTLPPPPPASDPTALKAFKFLDPLKDKKSHTKPTANEILNLVTYGNFNDQRCLSTLPSGDYVVPRHQISDEALNLAQKARTLLVHSRIGNGKSIFLYILAHKLSEQGYRSFLLKSNPLVTQQDLDVLKTFNKVALFFDSYDDAISNFHNFTDLPDSTKFIVAIRTGIQEVRLHEITTKLPTPLQRIDLNGMRRDDINAFNVLLDKSGIQTSKLGNLISQCSDFRDVVLTIYNNTDIAKKIEKELTPVMQDESFMKVFVASHLLKSAGQDFDAAFLRTITQCDAYMEMAKFRETALDIFNLDEDAIQIRSAIFSEYIIQNYLKTADIIESAYSIITEAIRRKEERRYRSISSNLMRFSFLNRALRNDPESDNALMGLYERLRHDITVNNEPYFWLQYSILMDATDNLAAAEKFIDTAYDRATMISGFKTFQIDTYALGLLLRIEKSGADQNSVQRFDQIIEKIERVRSMIGNESHRFHAYKALEGIEPFISARIKVLSTPEKNSLVYHLNFLISALSDLSPEDQALTDTNKIMSSIERATAELVEA